MEQIMLSGDEWAVDENCIVHAAGNQFQISIKKNVTDKLKLKARDVIKIYVKKVSHNEDEPREIKNNFKKEVTEVKEPEEKTYN